MSRYSGKSLGLISFPMGGIGAGMVCIEGNGSIGSVSIKNKPDINYKPVIFSALTVKGNHDISRILEGPIADHSIFARVENPGNGLYGRTYGLPRFSKAVFSSEFPFANIILKDIKSPFEVHIKAWSPFIPNDEDSSSYPFAGIEYTFINISSNPIEAVYYFNSTNFLKKDCMCSIKTIKNGFIMHDIQEDVAFAASINEKAFVDAAWLRWRQGLHSRQSDSFTVLWDNIKKGIYFNREFSDTEEFGNSSGATISFPFKITPGQAKTVKLRLSWYSPKTNLRIGDEDNCPEGLCTAKTYSPWYTGIFRNIEDTDSFWSGNYKKLYREAKRFTDCFYKTNLPFDLKDAVSANLSILKSPTILRQKDGRIWCWEGCCDSEGCCAGSCTHVWNYAQAMCHLFPRIERGLRETEFNEMQDQKTGHQNYRVHLPIRESNHERRAACDGQLGGIIKVYREWRISGDDSWLSSIWPKIKQSMDFCISNWDKKREGIIREPHYNTYDVEFWGPDSMSMSFYLGALKALYEMGSALFEDCEEYLDLYKRGRIYLEERLFNGEYFFQKVQYEDIEAKIDLSIESPETACIMVNEGPKYQYGEGCLSDMVTGIWLAEVSGLSDIIDEVKLKTSLLSILKYNFKKNLSDHINTQRSGFALGNESGLVLCTWPKGNRPTLPMFYCDEVWTGIEYQVAAHLLIKGLKKEALKIVKACRERYDGTKRNPFNEYECGSWYGRALSSYSLLQAYTGVRYDLKTKTLYASTRNADNFITFLSTATGYGNVIMEKGRVKAFVISGRIEINNIIIDNVMQL